MAFQHDLDPAQEENFFTQVVGLSQRTFLYCVEEGVTVTNLPDLDKDALQAVAANARRPTGEVDAAHPAVIIPRQPFAFSAIALQRLQTAHHMALHCIKVNRTMTAEMLQQDRMRVFKEEFEVLEEYREKDNTQGPKLMRDALSIRFWHENVMIWTESNVGCKGAHYNYLTRTNPIPEGDIPLLGPGVPYAEEYGSLKQELVERCRHDDPKFRQDNQTFYEMLEKGTRGHVAHNSYKKYSRAKDGVGFYKAIKEQFLGEDALRNEATDLRNSWSTKKWKGNSNTTLEKFFSMHRYIVARLKVIGEETDVNVPTERESVEAAMNGFSECTNPEIMAIRAQILTDKSDDGPLHNFEKMVALFLPFDPVAKRLRKAGGKSDALPANVSAIDIEDSGKGGQQVGKTGVAFRHYTQDEYKKLTNEQKDELRLWRKEKKQFGKGKNKAGRGDGNPRPRKITTKQMKSIISEVEAQLKTQSTDASISDVTVATEQSSSTSSTTTSNSPTKNAIKVAALESLKKRHQKNSKHANSR